jgi:hypothetical protein
MEASNRSRRSTRSLRPACPVILVAAACACQAPRAPGQPDPPDQVRLLAARDRGDLATMRAHGWELWRGLQDRWQRFERSDVVLGQPDRIFRPLRPFRNGEGIEAETLPVMFSVAFDATAAAHIRRYALGSRAALRAIHAVPEFPRGAIALKLVWYPVHHDRPTTLPIWDGAPVNPDARGNPDRTWRRTITIDPLPRTPEAPHDAPDTSHGSGAQVVPLAAFLHHTLEGAAELAAARAVAHDPSLAPGDHVVLLGMHVTTKEIPDWVWATFWWHDRPGEGRFAEDRPATLGGAASHYLMDVAYSAETPREPDGSPHACMNPWLEARFPGGLHSNCLTCHQRAAFGAARYLPVTRTTIPADDPYFAGKTTTDFLWTLALEAHWRQVGHDGHAAAKNRALST